MSIIEYTGPSTPQDIRKYLMRRTKEEIIHEYLRQWREYGDLEEERDSLSAQVDRLNGIIEHTAPCVFHDNAHADCVQHSGQAPCMTQTEPEWLAEIQKERDALAAHVERLEDIIERSTLADSPAAESALEDTPETSLARLKAEIRWHEADLAVETLRSSEGRQKAMGALRSRAEHLRRQAEESDHG